VSGIGIIGRTCGTSRNAWCIIWNGPSVPCSAKISRWKHVG
jgi:hypothetical protein